MTADNPPAYSPTQSFTQLSIGSSTSSPTTRTVQCGATTRTVQSGAPMMQVQDGDPTSKRPASMCAITLFDQDKMRLVNTPKALTPLLRQIIQATWGAIQNETEQFEFAKGGPCTTSGLQTCASHASCTNCARKSAGSSFYSLDLKLKGNICAPYGIEKVRSRRLMVELFKCMARHGWNVAQSTKVIRLNYDLGTFVFAYSGISVNDAYVEVKGEGAYSDLKVPPVLIQNVEIFAIAFHRSNIIRVIDGPAAVYPFVQQAIRLHWPPGLKKEKEQDGTREFHLDSTGLTNALYAENGDAFRWTMVLIELLSLLQENLGFKLYTSATMASDHDLESWFLRKTDASWS
ncbi:MAG: hypothetical protein BYD32DRAFT_416535 [Podila humilis]|nr:MAG: hypothetical protein BYD32DRAFT_416535 [Podila humilis]